MGSHDNWHTHFLSLHMGTFVIQSVEIKKKNVFSYPENEPRPLGRESSILAIRPRGIDKESYVYQ